MMTMIRDLAGVSLALVLFTQCLGSCAAQEDPTRTARVIKLRPCHLSSPGLPARIEAKCGTVKVPENWDRPAGKRISIHLAVIDADTNRPRPDPLFLFAGGPGQAATEAYVTMTGGFYKINRTRDIVLIDQRGTGKSNRLQCKPPSQADPLAELTDQQADKWLRECAVSLKTDLTQYTTSSSIKDFEFIRRQLGYSTINIYGISYGTRVALTYLREYGAHVRAVILDGVLPQQKVLGPEILMNGPRRAKENLLRRCRADPDCKRRFPRLAQLIQDFEQQLQSDPARTKVIHPRTGEAMTIRYSWESWSQTLRFFGYSSEAMAILPLLIDLTQQRGNFAPIVVQSLLVAETLGRSINNTLENSVLCSEDWPFFKPRPVDPAEVAYGVKEVKALAKICALWPHRPVDKTFKRPVVSRVPVLVLSGEFDPVTPPENGALAAKHLKDSLHLVAPGMGHGVITRGCIPDQAARFLKNARTADVDPSCVKKIKPLPFFVDFAGPEA